MKNSKNSVQSIALSKILPDPYQPRKKFDENAIAELAQSIHANGLLQPIILRKISDDEKTNESIVGVENLNTDADYMIVAGERRYRAHEHLKLNSIDAIIRDYTDIDTIREIQIIENLQRKDVSALEEAEAFAFLNTRMNAENIALKVGRSTPFVYQRLKLNSLAEPFKNLLSKKFINLKNALAISDLRSKDQLSIYEELTDEQEIKSPLKEHQIRSFLSNNQCRLDKANWDLDQNNVIKSALDCSSCSYNSINRGFLFQDDEKPTCNNKTCYQLKKTASLLHFINERKNDQIPVVIETHYMSEKATMLANIFKDHKFDILTSSDVFEIYEPEPLMTIEEYKEDQCYDDPNDVQDDDIKNEYKAYVEEHQLETEDYQKEIKSDEAIMVYMIDVNTYNSETKYVTMRTNRIESAIEEKSISNKKMNECTPLEQIEKIKMRENRKKEIEAEKEYLEIRDLFDDQKITKKDLTKIELISFIVSVGYKYKYYFRTKSFEKLIDDINNNTLEQWLKKPLSTLNGYRNQIMKAIAVTNVNYYDGNSHLNDITLKAHIEVIREQYGEKVEAVEVKYQENEKSRLERINERVEGLKKLIS